MEEAALAKLIGRAPEFVKTISRIPRSPGADVLF
jgi:hypothetical protein